MKTWYRFWYHFLRKVAGKAYGFSCVASQVSHACYVKGGKTGRRAQRWFK